MYVEVREKVVKYLDSPGNTNKVRQNDSKKLSKFDLWWNSLIPTKLKTKIPPWFVLMGILVGIALFLNSEIYTTLVAVLCTSTIFALCLRKLISVSPYIARQKWLVSVYHAILFAFIAKPVMAQEVGTVASCNTNGLFGAIGNFVVNIFAAVTFGSVGGATLSNLICQVIAYITLSVVLSFLVAAAYAAYQITFNQQPVSVAATPLYAFLIFAGVSSVIIGVMIGDGSITS